MEGKNIMLAKLWKKILLAICIIACIFNIMSKLVNRHSLKENLESANDGVTVFDIFKKDNTNSKQCSKMQHHFEKHSCICIDFKYVLKNSQMS